MINEVYILDSDFNALGVIDEFISCIWTERYSKAGDFELYCPVNDKTTALFYRPADDYSDRYAMIRDSNTYMVIENVLLTTDAEDGDRYTVTGRGVESVLDRRVIWNRYAAQNVTISSIISSLVTANATNPSDGDRRLSIFRPSGAAWFLNSSRNAQKQLKIAEYYGENLYDTIVELCEANHIGFRAVPKAGGKFQLQLYDGQDRTYSQYNNSFVVFSGKFDNLLQSRWQKNTAGYRNYILVRGDEDYDPAFLDGDALLKARAQANAQAYSGAYQQTRNLAAEIKEEEQRLYDLKARLAKLYNVPDSAANQMERESLDRQIDDITWSIGLSKTALTNAENDYRLWRYWTDVQEKLGDPVKQKMMLCSPETPVTGMARREMWVDDDKELEKSDRVIELEEENKSLQDRIDQLWESYYGNVDPTTGLPMGDIETVKEQVAALRSQIKQNEQTIEIYNKQTLDEYYSHLSETGRLAMAEHSVTTSFDGAVDSSVQYHFGEDFFLGDLVQIRNEFGMEAVTRVTEVVRSRDESGDSIIPTFISD